MSITEIQRGVEAVVSRERFKSFVRRISLFGSQVRDDHTKDSDVDLLIETSRPIGFFMFMGLSRALEEELKARVDLVTPNGLSPYIKDAVLRQAKVIYDAA